MVLFLGLVVCFVQVRVLEVVVLVCIPNLSRLSASCLRQVWLCVLCFSDIIQQFQETLLKQDKKFLEQDKKLKQQQEQIDRFAAGACMISCFSFVFYFFCFLLLHSGQHKLLDITLPNVQFTLANPATAKSRLVVFKVDTGCSVDIIVPHYVIADLGFSLSSVIETSRAKTASLGIVQISKFGKVQVILDLENPATHEHKQKTAEVDICALNLPPPAPSPPPDSVQVYRRRPGEPEVFLIGYTALLHLHVRWDFEAGTIAEITFEI